jgi:hypothetical protein
MAKVRFPVGAEFFLFTSMFRINQLHMQCEAGKLPLFLKKIAIGDRQAPLP